MVAEYPWCVWPAAPLSQHNNSRRTGNWAPGVGRQPNNREVYTACVAEGVCRTGNVFTYMGKVAAPPPSHTRHRHRHCSSWCRKCAAGQSPRYGHAGERYGGERRSVNVAEPIVGKCWNAGVGNVGVGGNGHRQHQPRVMRQNAMPVGKGGSGGGEFA